MGFVKVVQLPKEACPHRMPDDKKGKAFGKGTVWRCDNCGSAFMYGGGKQQYDQRDNDSWWDAKWDRAADYDGPDNRPLPVVPRVDSDSCGLYAPGTK